jgi:hypothetical protein
MATNNYEVQQLNDFIYELNIKGEDFLIEKIYESLKLIMKNSFYDNGAIFFSAESVKNLKSYLMEANGKLSQKNCINIIDDLTKQIIYLRKNNYAFYGFDINDIIVIDDNKFIICSSEYLIPLIGDNMIFYSPIKKPYFFNPEVDNVYELPSEINYKCSYYSLGILIVFCFLNKYLLKGNEIKSEEEIEKELICLKDTKIYWFLKRCLKTDIEKRELLLI